MQTPYIDNLDERKAAYQRFWRREKLGRPLVSIYARREDPLPYDPPPSIPRDPEKVWLDPNYVIPSCLQRLASTLFLGDSIPHIAVDLGPGSLAAYLGSRVTCNFQTVWFDKVMDSLTGDAPLFSENNIWWKRHFDLIAQAAEIGRERGFYVAIPDLTEGLDVLAALRGPKELIMDLMRDPGNAHRHLENITKLYFRYYDLIHDTVADADGWSICTYLEPFGRGRTGKIQCDFAALLNPTLFSSFAAFYIKQQVRYLDHVSYHLDGPGAIYSTRILADMENIRVVQWVPGIGQPPHYDQQWETQVLAPLIEAGKVIQFLFYPPINLCESGYRTHLKEIVLGLTRLVKKYGPDNFWFIFKYGFSESVVEEVLLPAVRQWRVA